MGVNNHLAEKFISFYETKLSKYSFLKGKSIEECTVFNSDDWIMANVVLNTGEEHTVKLTFIKGMCAKDVINSIRTYVEDFIQIKSCKIDRFSVYGRNDVIYLTLWIDDKPRGFVGFGDIQIITYKQLDLFSLEISLG